jgi:hypothetical protein
LIILFQRGRSMLYTSATSGQIARKRAFYNW